LDQKKKEKKKRKKKKKKKQGKHSGGGGGGGTERLLGLPRRNGNVQEGGGTVYARESKSW